MHSDYLDVEIKISKQEEAGYPVTLTWGEAQQSPAIYLRPLEDIEPLTDGSALFNWLMFDETTKQIWGQIYGQNPKRRLRLNFEVTALDLHALPWETLSELDENGLSQVLATADQTPLSRYIANSTLPMQAVAERPLKMLALIANPANLEEFGLPALDYALEQTILADAVSDVSGQVQVDFLSPPVTLSALETALREGYQFLHLVAHGKFMDKSKQSVLYLADEQNQVKPAIAEDFLAMLSNLQGNLPHLLFLAACQGATQDTTAKANLGLAPRLVQVGLPAVLAMQDKVQVQTARTFSQVFYRQLLRHGLVDLATNQARAAIMTAELPDQAIPVLFSRLVDNRLLIEPDPDSLPIIERQPSEPETVYIAEGDFYLGCEAEEGIPAYEQPRHQVYLEPYRIGKYPVTNEEYAVFVAETDYPVGSEMGWHGQEPEPETLKHPVSGVSWYDALAYCQWLTEKTGRAYTLPTEAQWEKAARGKQSCAPYPWGAWAEGRCHYGGEAIASVCLYPAQSDYDCYDLVGNVREWTCSLWGNGLKPDEAFYYPWTDTLKRNDTEAGSHIYRVYRGGSYKDSKQRYIHCGTRRGEAPTKTGSFGKRLGFRVALNFG